MTELMILLISCIKLGIVVACAVLYSMGGRDEFPKYFRRFIAPCIIGIVLLTQCIIFKHSFMACLYSTGAVGLLMLGFSMGYGASSTLAKILKRLAVGCVVCSSGFLLATYTGIYWLAILQAITTISAYVILGVTNPVQAVEEEMLIGAASMIYLPFYL